MNGADYVAVRRLSNLANDTLAAPGESCEKVDPKSLPHLLAAGDIRPRGERRKLEEPPAQTSKVAPREEAKPLDESGFVGEE